MVSNVKVRNLTKRFGETVAVNDIDIDVEEGKLIALLGPSGCGKTTTLRSISGLETIDEGEIEIGGRVVASAGKGIHVPPYERNVGMMFQSNALWPHMSVEENILYPLKQKRGADPAEYKDRVAELLDLVELPGTQERSVNELSGGQQQRIALARSLIHEPDVLLMDEPLSSLDARLAREMRADLRALQQQRGYTTIYVTHDQQEAMYMADEIYLMQDGRLVERGPPEQIYNAPKETFSMEFLDPNDPIEGEIREVHDSKISVNIPGLSVPLIATVKDDSLNVGSKCRLYIRPTDVEVASNGDQDQSNVFDSEIELCAFQGSKYEVRFRVGEYSILGEVDQSTQVGDTVKIKLDPEKVRGFSEKAIN